MVKPRVTATDKLSNVIEVVGMGRRTGLLSVERGTGTVIEVGEIYFSAGRPTYAAFAGLRGNEAFAALSHWAACRFAFDGDVPRPVPNILPTNPSLSGSGRPTPHNEPSQPVSDYRQSQPGYSGAINGNGRVPEGSGIWALPTGPDGYPQTGLPGMQNSAPSLSQPGNTNNIGNPNGSRPSNPQMMRSVATSPSLLPPVPNSSPSLSQPGTNQLGRRPRRAPDVRDLMRVVTTHNLSRNHRTILLLADGEHTILDLARLSSKPVDEIVALLADLESRGLVYYYAS